MTARSPMMVTLFNTRFVECRWWNDGWPQEIFSATQMDRLSRWLPRLESTAATMVQRCTSFRQRPLPYKQQAAFTISWCSASDSSLCRSDSKQRLPSAGVQLQTAASSIQTASSVYHQLVFSFRQRPLVYRQQAAFTISWCSASDSGLFYTDSKQRLPSAGVQLQTAASAVQTASSVNHQLVFSFRTATSSIQTASSVYHQLVFSFRQRPLVYRQQAAVYHQLVFLTDVLLVLEALSNSKEPRLMDAAKHSTRRSGGFYCGCCCSVRCPWEMRLVINLQTLGASESHPDKCTDLQGEMYHRQLSPQACNRGRPPPPPADENRSSFSGLEPVTIASTSTCSGSSDWPRP